MKKKHMRGILFLIVGMFAFFIAGEKKTSRNIEKNLKENIIRFHVRANSDSKYDQRNKLKVRDAVVDYVSSYMENADTKEEAMKILRQEKGGIQKTAEETLRRLGDSKKIKVYYTTETFPEKTYGNYTFPEGVYDAVRVDIGTAKGHNWWCVMFPDLCVTKDDEIEINQSAKKKMEQLLGKKAVNHLEANRYLQWLWK